MTEYHLCNMEIDQSAFDRLFSKGKNKILYSLITDEKFLEQLSTGNKHYLLSELDKINLYEFLKQIINFYSGCCKSYENEFNLIGFRFLSNKYRVDLGGFCEDGDPTSIRYILLKTDKVYKMKASKFFHNIIEEEEIYIPEVALRWMEEEFLENWKVFRLKNTNFKLKYGNDIESFAKIYSSGNTDSCMNGAEHISFYINNVNCTAAWLEDSNNKLVARCVIFNEVFDSEGNIYRLAERQYANDGYLKEILILYLIDNNLIDGYKKIGAGCGDCRKFLDINGNPLKNDHLRIKCVLNNHDIISYQDSFKYYNYIEQYAYNYESYVSLSDTCKYVVIPEKPKSIECKVYCETLKKRIPITYIFQPSDFYIYESDYYVGNYVIINDKKVPIEKVIYQYDLNGNLISMFASVKEIIEKYSYKTDSSIYRCLRGDCKTAYKYVWKYR